MKFSSNCCGCFSGLSAKARIEIVNLLQKKEQMSVLEIAKHFKLTQPTITHHLQYLKRSGILDSKQEGRKVFYFINQKCKKEECGLFARTIGD